MTPPSGIARRLFQEGLLVAAYLDALDERGIAYRIEEERAPMPGHRGSCDGAHTAVEVRTAVFVEGERVATFREFMRH